MDALLTWLRELGLERYGTVFAENDVDLDALRLLTDAELEKLGVSLGHRKKLLRAIEGLRTSDTIAPPRSPDSYTPKHLVEKILTSKSALEGERKQVTVLFADIKGSMELLADRDPEQARNVLDPVLERMMEAVHRYEGTVNQVMGDGIMALFGAPLAHEDHAVRACYAALRMQQSVARYSDERQRSGAAPIEIRVGLNSGEVVVRSIGSDLRMDYTAVGQTTHLAARLEQIAKAGSALLTRETLKLTEGYVAVKPLGVVPIKGLGEPIEVYELTGAGPVRTRFQAVAARGLTRFVGRDAELEQLRRALRLAGEGHGQVVAVVGEPGVGKSRLFFEFTRSHLTQGWLILESGSVSYGKATPYLPIIDLLKGYFKIHDRDERRDIREKVTGKLLALDRSLEPMLPAFLALLDVPAEHAQWNTLDPPQRRQLTLEAIKNLLLRESAVQPLLLVFEDLHWVDSETQVLLDGLVERLPAARVLLLGNYRPEYQHAWGGKTYYSQLRLDTLAPDTAEELLRVLLGEDAGLEALKQVLIANTEGNPFFLEESVRTLVETGALAGGPGAYRLAHALGDIRVPPTVQAVLAARIDRLSPEEKRLLQTAAVIGKDVPFALLQAVAELSQEELGRGLTDLQGAEFLYETSLFPALEYTFKHALTHEVAYQGLLAERRRALHSRIVEAIERLYLDNPAEQIESLAHHALRGEAWEKALHYLGQAGARAAARSANREATAWFEQALEVARRLPENTKTLETAIDLRFDLRRVLLSLGEFEPMSEHLREAERLAQALGDRRRLAWILCGWTIYRAWLGDTEEALRCAERARSLGDDLAAFDIQIVASNYLGWVHHIMGEYRHAASLFRESASRLCGDLVRERFGQAVAPAVYARARLARESRWPPR